MHSELFELCRLNGVSGDEDRVRDYLVEKARPYADSMRTDALGNLIVFKKGAKSTGNKLLIEVKNPYDGQIRMVDGLPSAKREGHGYGCRVIRNIADLHQGLCSFATANNLFVLRVVLPLT